MNIGVLIATYNGIKYIKEQIDSILNQKDLLDEIIISDDNSTDGTYEFLKKYLANVNDVRIKIVRNKTKGIFNNFYNAYSYSKSDYLFFSDQDDVWLDNKVELFKNAITKYPECGLYFSDGLVVNSNLETLNCTNFDNFVDKKLFDIHGDITCILNKKAIKTLMLNNFVTGMSMMVRKDILENCFKMKFPLLHDDIITMYSALNSDICCINKVTALYRQHENNVIGAKNVTDYIKNEKIDDATNKSKNRYILFAIENCYSIKNVIKRANILISLNHNDCNIDLLNKIKKFCEFRGSLLFANSFIGIMRIISHVISYFRFTNWKYFVVDLATVIIVRKKNRNNPFG